MVGPCSPQILCISVHLAHSENQPGQNCPHRKMGGENSAACALPDCIGILYTVALWAENDVLSRRRAASCCNASQLELPYRPTIVSVSVSTQLCSVCMWLYVRFMLVFHVLYVYFKCRVWRRPIILKGDDDNV